MKAIFTRTKTVTTAYIQKSIRKDGRCTSITVKRLGTLKEIQEREGCADPEEWCRKEALRMTLEEKEGKRHIDLSLSPTKSIGKDSRPLRHGGDLMLLGLYNCLGLPEICDAIVKGSRVKYDLNAVLQTLVTSRILFPCSKSRTMELAKGFVKPPKFRDNDMYRALSQLSGNIDLIQAEVYRNSLNTCLAAIRPFSTTAPTITLR